MGLPWFRFDVNFPQHDKILRMLAAAGDRGKAAAFVYVCGLAYCANVESDGVIPFGALVFAHGKKRDADLLLEHGLWRPHPAGWEVVNYLERQPSADTIRQGKADRTKAARKANCVRWHGEACGCWQMRDPPPRLRAV